MGIGLAHRCDQHDVAMHAQGLLDARRVDVVAAADDHILGAAGDPQIAVSIDAAEIARIEPAVGHESAVVVCGIDVARGHAGSADQHRTDFIDRAFALQGAVGAESYRPNPRIRQSQSRRAESRIAIAWPLRHILCVLGGAVGKQDAHTGQTGDFARHSGRQRSRAGGHDRPQRAQVLAARRILRQHRQGRRHPRQHRNAKLLDKFPVIQYEALVARAQRRRDDDAHRTGDGHDTAAEKTRDVEHRIIRENHVFRRMRHDDAVGPTLVAEAAMGQLHQLRRRGSPTRVHVGRDVVRSCLPAELEALTGML